MDDVTPRCGAWMAHEWRMNGAWMAHGWRMDGAWMAHGTN
jgi:hypothetical protein